MQLQAALTPIDAMLTAAPGKCFACGCWLPLSWEVTKGLLYSMEHAFDSNGLRPTIPGSAPCCYFCSEEEAAT